MVMPRHAVRRGTAPEVMRSTSGAVSHAREDSGVAKDAPAPVDVVDRVKPQPVHGPTWHRVVDGALDHIGKLQRERSNALDALAEFLREHPEFEDDDRLVEARLALL